MKNYEALILLRPDLNDQDLQKEISKLSQPILQNEGKIASFDKWAKRALAYKIKRFQDGIYLLANFTVNPLVITGIERIWKLDENVLRAMVVVKPKQQVESSK